MANTFKVSKFRLKAKSTLELVYEARFAGKAYKSRAILDKEYGLSEYKLSSWQSHNELCIPMTSKAHDFIGEQAKKFANNISEGELLRAQCELTTLNYNDAKEMVAKAKAALDEALKTKEKLEFTLEELEDRLKETYPKDFSNYLAKMSSSNHIAQVNKLLGEEQ